MKIRKLGRYEIVGELGHGAMGTVYRAIDPLIERTVAIKTINLDLSGEELAVFEERFYREAKSAGQLSHPNIVTIYDVGESDNIAYIAMEFLEGQSLRELLDSGAALSAERIGEIAAQVAEGMAYAQQHGIVHRDIKPANIVITRNGVAKITDFGIAHMPAGSRTLVGMVLGSPKYMSPEQVVGKPVDGRSDIFSLGVLLYEMLTGRPPFDGDNISTIMYRILNEMPAAPHALNPNIPEAFDWIVAKALAKHPDDRYQDAREFADELRHYRDIAKPAGYPPHHGTLERRSMPRSGASDPTLLLQRVTDGDATQPIFPAPVGAQETLPDRPPPALNMRRFLYGGIAALLATFMAIMLLGKNPPPHSSARPASAPPGGTASTPAATLPMGQAANPAADAPPAADKPAREGLLVFAVTPWGEIYVDDQKVGIAPPLKELKVAAGKHRIEIRNQNLQPYTLTLDVAPDATLKIKHKFQ